MFCPSCGTKNEAEARFCGSCGISLEERAIASPAHAAANERIADGAGQARFAAAWATASPCPPVEVEARFVDDHRRAAAAFADEFERREHASEAERLRKSLTTCRILGIVLALITVSSMVSSASGATNPLGSVGFALFMGANMFFVPYGLAPILRWTGSHGFFIVFNWIFIICAFALLILVAIVASPIYIIWAKSRIKQCEAMAACYN